MHRCDKICRRCWRYSFVAVMVFACRQRRILRIVAFIAVACVIFLCFQVFLVGFLDHDAQLGLRRGARPKFGLENDNLRDESAGRTSTTQYPLQMQQKLESECSSHNCNSTTKLLISTFHAVISGTTRLPSMSFFNDIHTNSNIGRSRFENVWEFLEHEFARPVISEKNTSEAHSTIGVNRRWQYLYEADDNMQFTCIFSQVYLRVV